jgi:hypothetical protein
MQLALIFPDDDGPDLQAPHGLGPLLGNRGEQLSQRGRESPESLFLQEMGERSGDQVLGQGLWRRLSLSFPPQRAKVLDAERRNALELSVEIRDSRWDCRLPTSGRFAMDQAPAAAFGSFAIR